MSIFRAWLLPRLRATAMGGVLGACIALAPKFAWAADAAPIVIGMVEP